MTKNSKTILTAIAITAIASLFGATGYLSMSTPVLAVTQTAPEGPNGDGDGETNDGVDLSTSDSSVNQKMPGITGSINVGDTIKNYINTNKKVSFVEAATTAEKQITNGAVVEGNLDIKQGYLVYSFNVVDTPNNLRYHIIIDAGNGLVLYKSDAMQVESHGMHDFGENK